MADRRNVLDPAGTLGRTLTVSPFIPVAPGTPGIPGVPVQDRSPCKEIKYRCMDFTRTAVYKQCFAEVVFPSLEPFHIFATLHSKHQRVCFLEFYMRPSQSSASL